jgi:hypothetical protein
MILHTAFQADAILETIYPVVWRETFGRD